MSLAGIAYNPKALKARMVATQATRRITSAMKMVAVTKLKKAQDAAEQARPYAKRMTTMMASLTQSLKAGNGPTLLVGNGKQDVHLLVVISSDRGLCGGFNGQIIRQARQSITKLRQQGKTVKLITIGRKVTSALKAEYGSIMLARYEELNKPSPAYAHADEVASRLLAEFEAGSFDCCTLIYNQFISTVSQKVSQQPLIPFAAEAGSSVDPALTTPANSTATSHKAVEAPYEFEPDEEVILQRLLPQNIRVQIFAAMLDSFAGEQAARMVAMDNATRNATDMINFLVIRYNRVRQAFITKELIEIISGAEAL